MASNMKRQLGRAIVRDLAERFDIDERSLEREYLAPGSVRGRAGLRARQALAEVGLIERETRNATPDWLATRAAVTRGPHAIARSSKTR